MGANINSVYQKVLAIANKEQRGYITPQEFNLFANQVQQDIFEQYFYDLNVLRAQRPQEFEIGDSVSHIMEKIKQWYVIEQVGTDGYINEDGAIGKLFYNFGGTTKEMTEVTGMDEIQNMRRSRWHSTGSDETFYFREGHRKIQAWEKSASLGTLEKIDVYSKISYEVIKDKPGLVYWGYVVVNENPTWNPSASKHFELHHSEQTDVVVKILKLAGISIEDPQLYQAAASEEQQNLQQENK